MSSIGTGYDLSASQFSPDGRVFQVEYAMKAVENSSTAIGIRGKDGVVLAVEKLITSKLFEPTTNKRIFHVDEHIGMATAGLLADARALGDYAQNEACNYRERHQQPSEIKYLANRISDYVHAYTLYSALRPYGACVIFGAYEKGKPSMYMVDPSGTVAGFSGCAVGKGKQAAKTELEKLKMNDMSIKQLVKAAAKIIYQVHDDVKDKAFELELSWVGECTNGHHEWVPENIKKEAEKEAKAALDESDSDHE